MVAEKKTLGHIHTHQHRYVGTCMSRFEENNMHTYILTLICLHIHVKNTSTETNMHTYIPTLIRLRIHVKNTYQHKYGIFITRCQGKDRSSFKGQRRSWLHQTYICGQGMSMCLCLCNLHVYTCVFDSYAYIAELHLTSKSPAICFENETVFQGVSSSKLVQKPLKTVSKSFILHVAASKFEFLSNTRTLCVCVCVCVCVCAMCVRESLWWKFMWF